MSPKEQAPAFQFYARDFLSSSKVQRMSMTERGVYITLLAFEWLDGSLPTEPKDLAGLVGMKGSQFDRLWANSAVRGCFVLRDGRLVNDRLETEREKQQAFRDRQKRNGDRGGRPKGNPLIDTENPRVYQSEPRVLQTEDRRPQTDVLREEKDNVSGPPMDVWFRQLQADYPPHRVTRNARTEHAFVHALLSASDGPVSAWGLMQANLSANVSSHEWRVKGMVPWLEKYLTDGLWLNVLPPSPPAAEQISPRTARMLGTV